MRNIKLTLEYDGTGFSGWELQRGQRTARGELEKALQKVFKKKISIISASRTDAGVHALGQVVNFKIASSIPTEKIPQALNAILPDDVRVIKVEEGKKEVRKKGNKEKGFNARYDAKSKEYEYLIYNGEQLPVHFRGLVWRVRPKLNLAAMKKMAKFLVGKHDFSSFCAAHSDDMNFVRNLMTLDIGRRTLNLWSGCHLSVVSCKFVGNGFLYKMVRNIVGTLVYVGLGKVTPLQVEMILKAKDRKLAGPTAPARGLCLIKINY